MKKILLVSLLLGSLGCAALSMESAGVPDVSGTWVGDLSSVHGLLSLGGVTTGEVRVALTQQGRSVTGRLIGPGLRANLHTALYGHQLKGSALVEAGQGAGDLTFEAMVNGDRMEALIDQNPVTLRRMRGSQP